MDRTQRTSIQHKVSTGIYALVALLVLVLFGMQVNSRMDKSDETVVDTDDAGHARVLVPLNTIHHSGVKYNVATDTPQFVVLSFDGFRQIDMIDETVEFARKMKASDKPLHFTYFVAGSYFLPEDKATLYKGPDEPAGKTNIGFASNAKDVAQRVKAFNRAYVDGHEIGSHSVGHFDGTYWGYMQWRWEFDMFRNVMNKIVENNQPEKIDEPLFTGSIRGFRAPYLAYNSEMYNALSPWGFDYDSSAVGGVDIWPHKDRYRVWHIPQGVVFLGAERRPVVAMDYSIWQYQSGAVEEAERGTKLWQNYHDDLLRAYMDYFDINYRGNRAPVVIGNHFSKWNDGLYWEVMKDFAGTVCGRQYVRCTTFGELVEYLGKNGVPEVVK